MNENIQVEFDNNLNGYIIVFPEVVSLHAIEEWKNEFGLELMSTPFGQRLILLIDTNRHEFESIQCLKHLRDFLTTHSVIQSNGLKIVFVQPKNYAVSDNKCNS